ncbi:MAG TPA: hypothetical protein VFC19_04380 [Candidatus Limnocylindrales bacterium]|nr:hypothetical protein [Candidatus Limnocylindrales bacterium]
MPNPTRRIYDPNETLATATAALCLAAAQLFVASLQAATCSYYAAIDQVGIAARLSYVRATAYQPGAAACAK